MRRRKALKSFIELGEIKTRFWTILLGVVQVKLLFYSLYGVVVFELLVFPLQTLQAEISEIYLTKSTDLI